MKRIFSLLSVLCLLLCLFPLSVSAAPSYLCDEIGLLSETEQQDIEQRLESFSAKNQFDLVIYIVGSTDGKSIEAFADDTYDDVGYRNDGSILVLDMNEGEAWISTSGYGITAFTDYGIECLFDAFLSTVRSDPYSSLVTYISESQGFLTSAKEGEPIDTYYYYDDPVPAKRQYLNGQRLILSLIAGLIVSLIAVGVMKGKMKTVRAQNTAGNYAVNGSFALTRSQDLFLYRNITKIRRDTDNGSSRGGGSRGGGRSGGSSVHHSSSGHSHGGGGRHF